MAVALGAKGVHLTLQVWQRMIAEISEGGNANECKMMHPEEIARIAVSLAADDS